MGVTWQEFWGMNPHIINCIRRGYEEKIKRDDYLQHVWWGNYGLSAISVAVEHCLAGGKAKSKYIEKPVLRDMKKRSEPMSEEELQRQRELFVAKLEVMKTNFELNHRDSTGS